MEPTMSPPQPASTRSVAAATAMLFLGHPLLAAVASSHNPHTVDFHFPPECQALIQKFYRMKAHIEAERARAQREPFTKFETTSPTPASATLPTAPQKTLDES